MNSWPTAIFNGRWPIISMTKAQVGLASPDTQFPCQAKPDLLVRQVRLRQKDRWPSILLLLKLRVWVVKYVSYFMATPQESKCS